MTAFFTHLLALYTLFGMACFGRLWYDKAKRQIAAAHPAAKLHLYRKIVAEQITTTAAVVGLWLLGGIPAPALGFAAPRSFAWNMPLLAILVLFLVWSAWKLRSRAQKVREQLSGHLGALIPDTHLERRWFGAVSIGAGISEEIVFRGFLIYYLSLYLPQFNTWEKVVLTAAIFGVAHLYQGWRGIMGATILGLIAAALYVTSGSLLVPIVLHAVVDWRLLLMLPPDPEAEANAMVASSA